MTVKLGAATKLVAAAVIAAAAVAAALHFAPRERTIEAAAPQRPQHASSIAAAPRGSLAELLATAMRLPLAGDGPAESVAKAPRPAAVALPVAAITAPQLLSAEENSLVGILDPTPGPHQSTLAAFREGLEDVGHDRGLVLRVIQRIHKDIGICDTGPWLGGMGHGTTSMRGFERRGTRAVGGDRGRPQPAAQTCGAGADRACLC